PGWWDYCLDRPRVQARCGPRTPFSRPRRPRTPSRMPSPTGAPVEASRPAPAVPQRPREKLRARGVASLSDAELIALLLGSGTPGRSAIRIARALARRPPGELSG